MSTWIWRTLGIEPCRDIKAIKKAYAAKSKVYHPEEHPEEFKQLQNAYKAAMQYAKVGKEGTVVLPQDVSEKSAQRMEKNIVSDEYHEPPLIKTEYYDYNEIDSDTSEEKFWTQLQYMLWHPFVRKECDYWQYLLNRPDVQKLMQSKDFRERFLDRLKKENFIWNWHVLIFFNNYLEKFDDNESDKGKKLASKYLQPNILQDFLGRTKKRNDTDAEEKLYQLLWWNRDNGERNNPEKYLKLYFAYAEENKEKLREIHREAHAVRRGRPAIRIIIFIIVVVVCRFFVYIDELSEQENAPSYSIDQMLEQSAM